MADQKPSIGRKVHLTLSFDQAREINRRRRGEVLGTLDWPAGAQAHVGSSVIEGETVSMEVTQVHGDTVISGQALLNGNDSYWAQSVQFDADGLPGTWRWPPRT